MDFLRGRAPPPPPCDGRPVGALGRRVSSLRPVVGWRRHQPSGLVAGAVLGGGRSGCSASCRLRGTAFETRTRRAAGTGAGALAAGLLGARLRAGRAQPSAAARGAALRAQRDPWAVLGVLPTASVAEVRQAYRRKIRDGAHPDVGGDEKIFQELQEAYTGALSAAVALASGAAPATGPEAETSMAWPHAHAATDAPDAAQPRQTTLQDFLERRRQDDARRAAVRRARRETFWRKLRSSEGQQQQRQQPADEEGARGPPPAAAEGRGGPGSLLQRRVLEQATTEETRLLTPWQGMPSRSVQLRDGGGRLDSRVVRQRRGGSCAARLSALSAGHTGPLGICGTEVDGAPAETRR
ncbi:unnamed protein product [Prorocentrum cordatum]|uniref:J domain-containing protein n=1 Tax=Prorocentrum cordatum TaxID=2364126 RepID=A0ABN9T7H6_9DINO|nr:unnamed protein product [Polarella glacialis]